MQVYLVAVSARNASETYPSVSQAMELVQAEDINIAQAKALDAIKQEVFKPSDGWSMHQSIAVIVDFKGYANKLCYIHAYMVVVFRQNPNNKLQAVNQIIHYEFSNSPKNHNTAEFQKVLEDKYPEEHWLLMIRRRCFNIVPDDQVHLLN